MVRPPAGPTVRRWWPGTTWAESDCQHSLTASSWVDAGPCTCPRRGERWPEGQKRDNSGKGQPLSALHALTHRTPATAGCQHGSRCWGHEGTTLTRVPTPCNFHAVAQSCAAHNGHTVVRLTTSHKGSIDAGPRLQSAYGLRKSSQNVQQFQDSVAWGSARRRFDAG